MYLACHQGSEVCLACPMPQHSSFCLSEAARVWEHPVWDCWSQHKMILQQLFSFLGNAFCGAPVILNVRKCFEQRWSLCAAVFVVVSYRVRLFRSCNPSSCWGNEKELVCECYWPAVNCSDGGKTSNWFKTGRNCQRGGCFESHVGFVLSPFIPVSPESWRSKVPTVCIHCALLCLVGSGRKAASWWATASYVCMYGSVHLQTKKYLVGVGGYYLSPSSAGQKTKLKLTSQITSRSVTECSRTRSWT